ncbi:hypothetical protein, partial [Deinococcus sp.]|uniref:hypothetical protein n=1 Tax=Deinococcus sp. TaxID=47478 RepID=UPI00286996CC
MSDLAAVGRIISAMDIWVVASDLLEAMPFSQRHSLSGRDVSQELFIERAADGDPNVLTSSL